MGHAAGAQRANQRLSRLPLPQSVPTYVAVEDARGRPFAAHDCIRPRYHGHLQHPGEDQCCFRCNYDKAILHCAVDPRQSQLVFVDLFVISFFPFSRCLPTTVRATGRYRTPFASKLSKAFLSRFGVKIQLWFYCSTTGIVEEMYSIVENPLYKRIL